MLQSDIDNEISGFTRYAEAWGAEIVPVLSANAVSSGKFTAAALKELEQLLYEQLNACEGRSCDGAYFALHGAMVAEGVDDVEGHLLGIIRSIIGEVPLVISLDLHANVTEKMVSLVDGLAGFRTYPHCDFAETGERSAAMLLSMLESGRRQSVCLRKVPMIVPAENSQTSHGPFAEMWQEAEKGESDGSSRLTSLFPVQPWLDIEEMGCAVVVMHEDKTVAQQEAERLARLFWSKRGQFNMRLYTVDEVLAELSDSKSQSSTAGILPSTAKRPFVISDSSDSPGAGSSGDSNYVLAELLRMKAHQAYDILLTMVDAPAVAEAVTAGLNGWLEVEVGYSLCPEDGAPLKIKGKVAYLGDGRFTLSGGYATGTTAQMGRCAVLQIERLSLLLTERPTFSGDPQMYRSTGLEPANADLVLVKSANQFRADYEAIAERIFILDTPGRSPARLTRLSYTRIPRPCYPFDDFDW